MTVIDGKTYELHRNARSSGNGLHEIWLPILLFGSIGAIAWAIRGTDGFGPIHGTLLPGMIWGLLWYYVCWRKGIDARRIPLWLGLGIAIGGEWGYGQFVSWIQGKFYAGDEIIPVAPWVGYSWFVITGIAWGAPGGIALGWALNHRVSPARWVVRIAIPIGVGYLGWLLVQTCPWIFFPNYKLGIYAGELDRHLERTVYTNTQNFVVLAWWVGAMMVAAFQRDRPTLVAGSVIGGGFGIGFTLAACWCLGYSYAPGYVDWWKVWELNAGFNLGLLYVVVLLWAMRQVDKTHQPNGVPLVSSAAPTEPSLFVDKVRSLLLVASVFVLVFAMFFGGASRMGVVLELYDPKAVDQYAWPLARKLVFAPAAIVIVLGTLLKVWQILRRTSLQPGPSGGVGYLPERMIDLLMVMGFIGAVSIWPSEIGVLYAMFLCFSVYAMNRLNHRFDEIDRGDPEEATLASCRQGL